MKSIKRFCFGAVSSLLFACGLYAVGDRIDPITITLKKTTTATTDLSSAPSCVSECDVVGKSE